VNIEVLLIGLEALEKKELIPEKLDSSFFDDFWEYNN
jgi:hypothetical protein